MNSLNKKKNIWFILAVMAVIAVIIGFESLSTAFT